MDTRELHGLRYRCLEDCGFCCTFTPEVSAPELAALKAKLPALPVVRAGQTTLLAMQGGCGACTLLRDRRCTAYEERPAHCRYFPFHVYFGRRTQIYVNRSCRGVEVHPGGELQAEFKAQVGDIASPFRLAKHEDKAKVTHRAFERNARDNGVWGDVDAEVAAQVRHGARWFSAATWPGPTADPEQAGSAPEAWRVALLPFAEPDAMARPYLVASDLRWIGFRGTAEGITAETLSEGGEFTPVKELGSFHTWPDLPADMHAGLAQILARLAQRDLLAGSVFHLVDDTDYQITVAQAAAIRIGDIAADLALRADILRRFGVPEATLLDEVERFYDSAFLDQETIGGWL